MTTGSESFDVVVVGGGGAGLAAAAEAARLGRSAVLLEKNPKLGGSTAWSVGSVTATRTPHQKRAGITDSPDEHFEDLGLHAGPLAPRDNPALRRILVDNTTEMFEWLTSLGVVFVGPMPEPPHRHPRMHNVVPNSGSFVYHLARHCRRLGVDIRLDTTTERLVQENGKVAGVEARERGGGLLQFRARGGVVLASGDYSGAPDLKARFASPAAAEVDPVNVTCTGDGHRMALELGATVVNGDIMRGPMLRFIPPTQASLVQKLPPIRPVARLIAWSMSALPQRLMRPFLMSFLTTVLRPEPKLFREGAILVNSRGERFTDELGDAAYEVAQQPGRMAYVLFDGAIAAKFTGWPHYISTAPGVAYAYLDDYRRNRRDIYHRADSLEALARSMGVPPDPLAKTVADYNARGRGSRPAFEQGPYYALGPVKSYVVFTDGGLKVTERLEVTRADGSVIPGLYAAGSAGQGGVILEGHGHHLGWAFISGRIAGRNAARAVPPRATVGLGEQ